MNVSILAPVIAPVLAAPLVLLWPALSASPPAAPLASQGDCSGGASLEEVTATDLAVSPGSDWFVRTDYSGSSGACFDAPDGGCAGRPCTVSVTAKWRLPAGTAVQISEQEGQRPTMYQAPRSADGNDQEYTHTRRLGGQDYLWTYGIAAQLPDAQQLLSEVRGRCSPCE